MAEPASMARDSDRPHLWPAPVSYELCDRLSELLIYLLVVLCPWAFGTTTPGAMRIANAIGYALGLILLVKWGLRFHTGHCPPRWPASTALPSPRPTAPLSCVSWLPRFSRLSCVSWFPWFRQPHRSSLNRPTPVLWLTRLVALVTVALVGQCLISALNARATYSYLTHTFEYHPCISWLPHSYDSVSAWDAFWNVLAWAAAFWAVRDWLLGLSEPEILERMRPASGKGAPPALPCRLRRFLWVLSINGAALALEAIIQRASGTPNLLWIQPTFYNRSAGAQFGPFPYRANGGEYVNLIWPVTLGFWSFLHRRRARRGDSLHHLLLACFAVMTASAAMTLSRGVVLIAAANLLASGALLLVFGRRVGSLAVRLGILLLLGLSLGGGVYAVWDQLGVRMQELGLGFEGRETMTAVGRKMAADAPLFGTGPETVQPLYQLYRVDPDAYWPGQLHNDWLETRITFGAAGLGLILCGLAACLIRWAFGGGILVSWRFVSFFWLAMAGCLVHARWDLPFQVYSITLLFLLYCAILLCVSARP